MIKYYSILELFGNVDIRVLIGVILVLLTTFFIVTREILLKQKTNPSLITLSVPQKDGEIAPSIALPLIEKEILSHDTRRFRFGLPSEKHILGLPTGQHISLRFKDEEGKLVMRSYTPVSSDDTLGYVDLVIKVYFKNVHPKFPEGGKMSQHLENLKIGQTIEVSGPKGKFTYVGRGEIHIKHRIKDPVPEVRHAKQIGMIAGGTGITPMLQIIRCALKDLKDQTKFYLLFANQTKKDILCREEIDHMTKKYPHRVFVWYTIDRLTKEEEKKEKETWQYSIGFVNAKMIQEHLPKASEDTQILMCGPPPMLKFAVLPALEELGYTPNQHFSF
jgi:cytochrome-b5 reductase